MSYQRFKPKKCFFAKVDSPFKNFLLLVLFGTILPLYESPMCDISNIKKRKSLGYDNFCDALVFRSFTFSTLICLVMASDNIL